MKIFKLLLLPLFTIYLAVGWSQGQTPPDSGVTDSTKWESKSEPPTSQAQRGQVEAEGQDNDTLNIVVPDAQINQPGLSVEEVVATNAEHFRLIDFLVVWIVGWILKFFGVKDWMTKSRSWGRWVALAIFGVAFVARMVWEWGAFDLDEMLAIAFSTATAIGLHAGILNPGENMLKKLWLWLKQRREAGTAKA